MYLFILDLWVSIAVLSLSLVVVSGRLLFVIVAVHGLFIVVPFLAVVPQVIGLASF